jgi:alginate O-acetyltransferase complex protein AlgI
MLFNSYSFILGFLPVVLLVFWGLVRGRWILAAKVWLAIASLGFYGYWNIAYLPLLVLSILGNYGLGQRLASLPARSPTARTTLILGLFLNLGLLIYYKYTGFLLASVGLNLPIGPILLPLAISFFTFQQIAYLVETYYGTTHHYPLLDYTLFVCFFPQLIAGPIVRHSDIIDQFSRLRNFVFCHRNTALGLSLFSLGLFKKAVIADSLSGWVGEVFGHASQVGFLEAWIGAISYTLQLYFDFSGYSDMAIGLGLLFNIQLPANFNSPYKATSISDFWRRWHITLSDFLRDYLYIPLGGNRHGNTRRSVNLLVTMLLGGLWHGAGWTYVLWGGLHGLFLVINHTWRRLKRPLPTPLATGLTLLAVLVSWIVFRAATVPDALEMVRAIAGLKGIQLPSDVAAVGRVFPAIAIVEWENLPYLSNFGLRNALYLLGLTLGVLTLPNTQQILARFRPTLGWAIAIGSITTVGLMALNQVSEFLYFQF